MSPPAPRRSAGRLRAPAKLNFGLRVVGRRPDGYHLLQSLFVPIELADELELEVDASLSGCTELVVGSGDSALEGLESARNLAVRAARSFLQAAELAEGARITLEKRVPMGAGLGGGSSDAAAVLIALAELFPGRLPAPRLAELALELGADVPFFLDPRPALVSGIGEQIEPLRGFPALGLVLLTPAPPLSTARVFAEYAATAGALTHSRPSLRMRALPSLSGGEAVEAVRKELLEGRLLENDLEAVATRLRPEIGRLREGLAAGGAQAVGMSGSGPTVFGIFEDLDRARAAADRESWGESIQVHVTRPLVAAP